MTMVYVTICTGVLCFQIGTGGGKGFFHLILTTIGLSLLGCVAATVFSS